MHALYTTVRRRSCHPAQQRSEHRPVKQISEFLLCWSHDLLWCQMSCLPRIQTLCQMNYVLTFGSFLRHWLILHKGAVQLQKQRSEQDWWWVNCASIQRGKVQFMLHSGHTCLDDSRQHPGCAHCGGDSHIFLSTKLCRNLSKRWRIVCYWQTQSPAGLARQDMGHSHLPLEPTLVTTVYCDNHI